MHLSVAITRGWPRGTSGHLSNDIYKSPLPKTKIEATNAPPLREKKCALPSQKVQYFKRVPLAIINFLFAIIIYIYELIKNKQRKLFHLFSTHDEVQLTL